MKYKSCSRFHHYPVVSPTWKQHPRTLFLIGAVTWQKPSWGRENLSLAKPCQCGRLEIERGIWWIPATPSREGERTKDDLPQNRTLKHAAATVNTLPMHLLRFRGEQRQSDICAVYVRSNFETEIKRVKLANDYPKRG